MPYCGADLWRWLSRIAHSDLFVAFAKKARFRRQSMSFAQMDMDKGGGCGLRAWADQRRFAESERAELPAPMSTSDRWAKGA